MTRAERFETELPSDLADFVRSRVGHDALDTDADVLRQAVRGSAELQAWKNSVRQDIAAGFASLDAGHSVDGDAFMATLLAELADDVQQGR